MTVNEFFQVYEHNSLFCISLMHDTAVVCSESFFDCIWSKDRETVLERVEGADCFREHYTVACLEDESWWSDLKDLQVKSWGMYTKDDDYKAELWLKV